MGCILNDCFSPKNLPSFSGSIVFTSPTQQSDWLSAHMICETTGVTYNQLLTYLDDNNDLFTIFQPVQAVYYNETELSRTVDITSTQLQNRVKVAKKDSFWFVSQLVQQLNTYGADTESFLDIYGNAYQYVVSEDHSPEVISWEGTSSLNSVYQWYVALDQCYQGVFGASDNAEAFLTVRISYDVLIFFALFCVCGQVQPYYRCCSCCTHCLN